MPYPSGHCIHITNDCLSKTSLCKYFVKAPIVIPTILSQYWYRGIWSKYCDVWFCPSRPALLYVYYKAGTVCVMLCLAMIWCKQLAISLEITPVAPSPCGWVGRRPATPLHQLYPEPPGKLASSWLAPPPTSEKTDWLPVGPASPGPRSELSPAPAAPPAHTPNRRREQVFFFSWTCIYINIFSQTVT